MCSHREPAIKTAVNKFKRFFVRTPIPTVFFCIYRLFALIAFFSVNSVPSVRNFGLTVSSDSGKLLLGLVCLQD